MTKDLILRNDVDEARCAGPNRVARADAGADGEATRTFDSGRQIRVQRARIQLNELLLDCCRFELDQRGTILEMQLREKKCKAPCGGFCVLLLRSAVGEREVERKAGMERIAE